MKLLLLKSGTVLLKAAGALTRPFRVGNKVAFISRQSNKPSVDYLSLADEIKEINKNVKIVFLTKKIEGHLLSYSFHLLRQVFNLNTSKLVFVDGYSIAVSCLRHKPETTVIQTWHASAAIKMFGWQSVGCSQGHSPEVARAMHMHENYDIVLAPSRASAEYMSKAMNTDIDRFRIIILPHLEDLIQKAGEAEEPVVNEDGAGDKSRKKQTILYAPTFRRGKTNPVDELAAYIDTDVYDIIFKPHPSDETQVTSQDVAVSRENVYELIARSDIVISDYSSILIETAVLKKKTFVFAYDIDIYKNDPGLNIDFETEGLKDILFYDPKDIKVLLDKEYDYDALENFAGKYVEFTEDRRTFLEELM